MSILDQLSTGSGHVLVKAHGMDSRAIKLAQLANARLMISTRDPRDSVVSQRERLGLDMRRSTAELSCTFATIASLPPDLNAIRFSYEAGFTRHQRSVQIIAEWLGLKIGEDEASQIFSKLEPVQVQYAIESWLRSFSTGQAPGYDPITQWHVPHIGDGLVGKWKTRLDAASQAIVAGCLQFVGETGADTVDWHPGLFAYPEAFPDSDDVLLRCDVENQLISYGPYHRLPRGRWHATTKLKLVSGSNTEIEGEIFSPWNEAAIAKSTAFAGPDTEGRISICFDHVDQYQPLEARLRSLGPCSSEVLFKGWRLRWLGPLALT